MSFNSNGFEIIDKTETEFVIASYRKLAFSVNWGYYSLS